MELNPSWLEFIAISLCVTIEHLSAATWFILALSTITTTVGAFTFFSIGVLGIETSSSRQRYPPPLHWSKESWTAHAPFPANMLKGWTSNHASTSDYIPLTRDGKPSVSSVTLSIPTLAHSPARSASSEPTQTPNHPPDTHSIHLRSGYTTRHLLPFLPFHLHP